MASRKVDGYQEWIMGRHMPYIVDEQEEFIEYVVRHHEHAYHENFRPNKVWDDSYERDGIHTRPEYNPITGR